MRAFVFGVVLGVLIVGCAGFKYRYYGMDLPDYDGTLLGRTPADDVSFKECAPSAADKGKCVVLFTPEFEKLRYDLEVCQVRLKDCEKRCP